MCSLQNFSQVAFGKCLKAYAGESAARLAKAEREAAARIENWDEDVRHRAQARSALATSNAEFLRFRTRECGFASALAGGSIGTAHEHWRLACVYELNIRRAASLDGFVAGLPRRGS
ncbi:MULTISPECIES: lysozyme inhibitor LprI family protein [unclassified Caulobacter]|uniref:lysozyme inhibitor LprI family protein n=1 Tax=unclassified Caulobacter TaxID=2648921 RepID=UPI0006F6C30E|nr:MULTISPECIES: lysozyme inhibitor LprI family protein [unclassified Caulobacter]KQV57357.1 hypothetical protein ASC62_13960 [Caulobacter sp. Root342]KQV66929.1 hypothetical protein ASC70_14060 [Caulobacter sp. Root343]